MSSVLIIIVKPEDNYIRMLFLVITNMITFVIFLPVFILIY